MNLNQIRDFYNKKPVVYVVKENYNLIEDFEFILKSKVEILIYSKWRRNQAL